MDTDTTGASSANAEDAALSRSPLDAEHRALGATMVPFAGWEMPLRYGSETAEHLAVRADCGLFDLSHMAEIIVAGPEAAIRLDRALVGDMGSMDVGRARYTVLCADDGGVLDDLVVYRLTTDRYLVIANAANRDVVRDVLHEGAAPGEVSDETERWALLALQGPRSTAVLDELSAHPLSDLGYYRAVETRVGEIPALVARTGYTGEIGYEVFLDAEQAAPLWHQLIEAGVAPIGLAARDTLRLEAGMHLYGHELDRNTTPFDAGLARLITWEKPHDFRGRQALSLLADREPKRRLVGLISEGRRILRQGSTVRGDLGTGSPRTIGVVTSGAFAPTIGASIAMAYVDTAEATVDAVVEVDTGRSAETARIVELPFYRRPRAAS